MKKEHWILLALFLGVIGAQILTLRHGWADALDPPFIGTVLVQIGLLLRSFWSEDAGDKRLGRLDPRRWKAK